MGRGKKQWQPWGYWGLALMLVLGITVTGFTNLSLAQAPAVRGVWLTNVDSDVLYDRPQLETALTDLSNTGFNTLYPVVWNDGYTLFPSQQAAQRLGVSQDPQLGDRDVLPTLIEGARERNLRVIPWFEFGFMAPADRDWVTAHPQWLTSNAQGETVWLEGNVHPRVWLNPLHPEVQQLITALLVELVSRYDLDGIQLDDHFGYPASFGYDRLTQQLYQQETGKPVPPTPVLDLNQNCVVNDPDWQAWVDWRAEKIADYTVSLVQILRAVRPGLTISISPNPQTFSKQCFLLDWQSFLQRGAMDELVLQVYRDKQESFVGELQHPTVEQAKRQIPVVVGILSGLRQRTVPGDRLQQQVQWVRDNNFAGTAFFFYESLWNLPAQEAPNPWAFRQQWQRFYRQLNGG